MKIRFFVPLALTAGLLLGAPASLPDDEDLQADVTDTQGVTTRIGDLHYCYEEKSGEEVYITKYDDLFVERGDAVITVPLDSLASLEFTGKAREEKGKRLLEAGIRTRTGAETTALVVCHEGGFIKGNVDLGEFELPLGRVKKIVFSSSASPSCPSLRCFLPGDSAGPGETDRVYLLDTGGDLKERGSGTAWSGSAAAPRRVRLETAPAVTYPLFREALVRLARQGVLEVVLPLPAPAGRRKP